MLRSLIRLSSEKQLERVWQNDLKDSLRRTFGENSFVDSKSGIRSLPVARFISALYDAKVVRRDDWPTSKIIEEMHQRGYARDIFTKASYGAEPPPPLTLEECFKWAAYFRLVSLNRSP